MQLDEEHFNKCSPPSRLPVPVHPAETGSVSSYLESLPKDVGWLLMTAGVVAEVAPGVIGTPFWVAGIFILWPRIGRRLEGWMLRRAPRLVCGSLRQIDRFLDDLERRYPRTPSRRLQIESPCAFDARQ